MLIDSKNLFRPGESPCRRRHASEMSNPEFALYIEKENLRDAEENDYHIMENLIQRRLVIFQKLKSNLSSF